jgi:hypothetical protein
MDPRRVQLTRGMRSDHVDVRPLRDAVQRQLRTATPTELALCCGWVRPDGSPDASRFVRALGLASYSKVSIRVDTAEHLCRSLGIAPVDVGL